MKFIFDERQIEYGLNKFEIEQDLLCMEAEYMEGEGKNYIVTGIAVIEGERYHEFQIEFQLTEYPKDETLESIMSIDWEWYDYLTL